MDRKISKFVAKSVFVLFLLVCFMRFSSIDVLAANGDLEKGYNLDNLEYNFTTVDGESVSSDSEGKVKLIIFAKVNGNCQISNEMISSICSGRWSALKEIDVLIVDIEGTNVETVKFIRDSNASTNVKFCYGESDSYKDIMWKYVRLTKGSISKVSIPVSVIIDKDNKIQYCNAGYTSGKELYSYICPLLNFEENGELNDKDYAIGKDSILIYSDGYYDYDSAEEVFRLTNEARAKEGKAQLVLDNELTEMAMQRAAEQAILYSHTRPSGEKWYSILTNKYWPDVAENIAFGQNSAEIVTNSWLNSGGHYANIMNVEHVSMGVGSFIHNGERYWVQIFSGRFYDSYADKAGETKPVVIETHPDNTGEFSLYVSEKELEVGEKTSVNLFVANRVYDRAGLNVKTDNVEFESSDESIAMVDGNGNITAVSGGEVTITAILDETLVAKADLKVKKRLSGDVDNNDKVDASDSLEVLKYAARIKELNERDYLFADVTKHNNVDASDALMILKYAARIIDSLE